MNDDPPIAGAKADDEDFEQPIVVPFRGMPGRTEPTLLGPDQPIQAPSVEDLVREASAARMAKLLSLADRLGFDLKRPEAGLFLALRIATDYHPGFRVVYDEANARTFHKLFGFTPIHELKGRPPRLAKPDDNILKLLEPEFLAMLIPRPSTKKTDLEICEDFVKAADPEMGKRKNAKEMDRRAATLNRKLTEGRRQIRKRAETEKNQTIASGKKSDI